MILSTENPDSEDLTNQNNIRITGIETEEEWAKIKDTFSN